MIKRSTCAASRRCCSSVDALPPACPQASLPPRLCCAQAAAPTPLPSGLRRRFLYASGAWHGRDCRMGGCRSAADTHARCSRRWRPSAAAAPSSCLPATKSARRVWRHQNASQRSSPSRRDAGRVHHRQALRPAGLVPPETFLPECPVPRSVLFSCLFCSGASMMCQSQIAAGPSTLSNDDTLSV